jgi:serine/threonine protein kinase
MADGSAHATANGLVLGRYRPLRPLGSGGMGSVWHALDEKRDREVALKIVPRTGTAGPRAEREATAAAQLEHPACLRAYALARDDGHVYIAYEYIPGRTFRHALDHGELDDERAVEAAAQILEGLAHAHERGIVHRDVKPSNVLLADGPAVSVRLLDFGLALMTEEETLTAAGDVPGTLAYISPERLRGKPAEPATDVCRLASSSGRRSRTGTRSGAGGSSRWRSGSAAARRRSGPCGRTSLAR